MTCLVDLFQLLLWYVVLYLYELYIIEHIFYSYDSCCYSFQKVADQQSALFGECCFEKGDIKVTLGTGMMLDMNTGNEPHASDKGKISYLNSVDLVHLFC